MNGLWRLGVALITLTAAVALNWGAVSRGCAARDAATPEGAARAFIAASRAADKEVMWALLGPATRARLGEAAVAATERVGGARRYQPLDVLDVAVSDTTYAPTDVLARDVHGDRGFVDVLGPDGHRDVLTVVRVDGDWRVELDF